MYPFRSLLKYVDNMVGNVHGLIRRIVFIMATIKYFSVFLGWTSLYGSVEGSSDNRRTWLFECLLDHSYYEDLVRPRATSKSPSIALSAVSYLSRQVATRLGKESWPEGPESGHMSSPIRRMADFGRAMARAISGESLGLEGDFCAPAVGGAVDGEFGGNAGVAVKGTPPRGRKHGFGTLSLGYRGSSPASRGVVSPREHTRADDDFGVDLSKMSW